MIKIGEYHLYPVVTSYFCLDGGAMFGIVPKTLWEKKMPADDKNRIEMITRSLLLVSKDRKILIDSGNGDKWHNKFKDIYKIDTNKGNMESSLQHFGFSANDITDVICSHMHFDHIGGNTKYDGEKLVPVFQNARYWIHEDNWKLANSPGEKDQGSFMEADWQPLAENNLIRLLHNDESPFSGIELIVTNGHTFGQIHPLISDGETTLFYCADLIPTTAHIPIPWIMAYDIQPIVTATEKHNILKRAFNNNWTLFFEHDVKYAAGKVGFNGNQYHFKEEETI